MIDEILKKQASNRSNKSYSWQLGYQTFGPFLYGFCTWLHEKVSENKIDKLYFFARDGYIIKKAYEKIYGKSEKYKYFCLSRRSLMLPSMKGITEYNEIIGSLILPPSFSVNTLLEAVGLNISDSELAMKYNTTRDTLLFRNNYFSNDDIKKLIMDNIVNLQEIINSESEKFKQYMIQEEMNGNIAIIDIGWHNSIQNLLAKVMQQQDYKGNVFGFYVGVYKNAKKLPENHKSYGYLYDESNINNLQYKTFSFVSLFETMFLAHEGTTIGYHCNNDKIIPKKANYEYEGKAEMLNIVSEFQNGAIDFCIDAKKENIKGIPKEESYKKLVELGMHPNKKQIELFSKLEFENYTSSNLVNFNHDRIYYLLHLKTLKKDFYKSGWRIIFLKKLIPIPFPHYLLFKLLCIVFIK